MEEKKLTDEEIVKALEICFTFKGCTNECPYFKNGRNFCMEDKAFYKGLKDLIHRLQSENNRLNDIEFTKEHCDLYSENEFLKAELKRECEEQKKYIDYLKRKLDEANVTYRSRL